MAGGTQHVSGVIQLELAVPCDARFGALLDAVSRRMAAYIGYADADATAVAEAVMRATVGLLSRNAPAEYASLDLTFTTRGRDMEILLRYRRKDRSEAPRPSDIQQRLCSAGAGGAPVDAMRRVMAGVECGCRDGVEFCLLTKRLPDGPV